MKKILAIMLTVMLSFNFVKAEDLKNGFWYLGEEVPLTYYEYGSGVPLYDVGGYSVTARVYLDSWYNLNSAKTWNSVQSYNGKYEITINYAGLQPNNLYEMMVNVSINKGSFSGGTFKFYNVLDELDTTVQVKDLPVIDNTYFIQSEQFSSVNTLTKCVLTLDMKSGTGSHTYEVTGIIIENIEPDTPVTPPSGDNDSSGILAWLNDTWVNVMSGINTMLDSIRSTIRNITNPILESILTVLEDGLGVSSDVDTSTNDSKNEELNSAVNNYDSIEQGLVEDFNTNISNLNTDLNIFGVTDFVKTSTFVSTQLQTIYNSNEYIQYVVMFSLVLGIAMTIIGIKTRR